MERDPQDNLLNRYYQTLSHLRPAQKYMKDIAVLNRCLENFSPASAIAVLKPLVYRYKAEINRIGLYQTGIHTVGDTRRYAKKTEDDLMFDLMYLIRCILLIGAVHMGLEKTLEDALKHLMQDGCDIALWQLYV